MGEERWKREKGRDHQKMNLKALGSRLSFLNFVIVIIEWCVGWHDAVGVGYGLKRKEGETEGESVCG